MADDPKALALDACDEALKASVTNIASALLNAFISAKSDIDRRSAIERAHRGVELTKETHDSMKGIVGTVFT